MWGIWLDLTKSHLNCDDVHKIELQPISSVVPFSVHCFGLKLQVLTQLYKVSHHCFFRAGNYRGNQSFLVLRWTLALFYSSPACAIAAEQKRLFTLFIPGDPHAFETQLSHSQSRSVDLTAEGSSLQTCTHRSAFNTLTELPLNPGSPWGCGGDMSAPLL